MSCYNVDVFPLEYRQCPLDDSRNAHAQGTIPSTGFALSSRAVDGDCESTGNVLQNLIAFIVNTKMFHVFTKKFPFMQRLAVSNDMQEANRVTPGKYPDVSKWPIKTYDMPQQEDG